MHVVLKNPPGLFQNGTLILPISTDIVYVKFWVLFFFVGCNIILKQMSKLKNTLRTHGNDIIYIPRIIFIKLKYFM